MKKRGSRRQNWLESFGQLGSRHAALILAGVGLVVFCVGLASPFQGDDNPQIVDSPPVHSVANIGTLLGSSTFYNGQQLTGSYYRPLMTITYALIYSLFGPHPWAFHAFQLALYVIAAWLFFSILGRFINPLPALVLALIFLVHPLNSQVAFAIPSMQDALLGCFGFLSLWLIMSRPDRRGLWMAAGSLLLAMLAKETGLIFALLGALYLALYDRSRLKKHSAVVAIPLAVYALLRINALGLGLLGSTNIAPIDHLSLGQRLLTLPSIGLFYLSKLVFPWNLATRYYWTHSEFSLRYVLLPLVIDVAAISLAVWTGYRVSRRGQSSDTRAFGWFAAWAVIGILPYLQLIPLDMTACANWFFVPMAGILGMLGIWLKGLRLPKLPAKAPIAFAAGYAVILGVSTILQGSYYQTPLRLARHDLAASPQDYAAMGEIAKGLIDQGKFQEATGYARQSAQLQPTMFNLQNLGAALQYSGDFEGARQAYSRALAYGSQASLYENLGLLALESPGEPHQTEQTFQKGLAAYPQDFKLWLFYALYEDAGGRGDQAKSAIASASQYGQVPPQLYGAIMNNQPFTLPLPGTNRSVVVR